MGAAAAGKRRPGHPTKREERGALADTALTSAVTAKRRAALEAEAVG
jgi:hypothetical protein